MANMGKTNKRQIAVRLELTVCRAVEKKFKKPGDASDVIAYIRALEEATRDVILNANDYKIIQHEIEENELNRKNRKKGTK